MTLANKITTGRLLLTVVLFVLFDLLGRAHPTDNGSNGGAGPSSPTATTEEPDGLTSSAPLAAPSGLPGWPLATACLFLFIVITATDALDGYYARKLGQVSDFGRIADPAVDKVIICGSFIFISAIAWGRELVPPWIVVAIVGREFIVTALRGFMEMKGHDFGADPAGKIKMIFQCIAVPAVIFTHILHDVFGTDWLGLQSFFWWLAVGFVWATLLLTVVSGANYIKKAWTHLKSAGI